MQSNVTFSFLVVILGLIAALGSLSIDMYLPMFQDIASDLETNISSIQYSLSVFFVGISVGQLLYGPITDRWGRKLPMQFGLILYSIASIGCALSESANTLIAFRLLQALGGSAGSVGTRAIVRDRFAPNEAARVFSLLVLVFGVAPIIAPLAGGYIGKIWGWRAIFWTLVAAGIIAFLLSCTLKESLPLHKRSSSLSLKYVFSVYKNILQNKRFIGYMLTAGGSMAGIFSYVSGSSVILIGLYDIPKEKFGWIFGANALAMVLMSQLNNWLLIRHSFEKILSYGCLGLLIVGIYLGIVSVFFPNLIALLIGLFCYIGMTGLISPNASAGALGNLKKSTGSASALIGTGQFILGASASYIISISTKNSVQPMAISMAAWAFVSWISHRMLVRH